MEHIISKRELVAAFPRYQEAFANLHTARLKGYKAPHKAVLLLAIMEMVEAGVLTSACVELSEGLVKYFERMWKRYLGTSALFSMDVGKPFFHMQHEPFWCLVEHREVGCLRVAEDCALREKKGLPVGNYSLKGLRRAFAYAQMDEMLFRLMRDEDARSALRVVLVSGYLVQQPSASMPHL